MKTLAVSIPEGVYDAYSVATEQEKRKAEMEVGNLLKIIFRKNLNHNLSKSIENMRAEAIENGLTNEKLEEILMQIDNERTAELHS